MSHYNISQIHEQKNLEKLVAKNIKLRFALIDERKRYCAFLEEEMEERSRNKGAEYSQLIAEMYEPKIIQLMRKVHKLEARIEAERKKSMGKN